jgi:hypothetical protein
MKLTSIGRDSFPGGKSPVRSSLFIEVRWSQVTKYFSFLSEEAWANVRGFGAHIIEMLYLHPNFIKWIDNAATL